MSKQSNQRFLKIPGENKFVHDFKFSTRLPNAIPTSKTIFIPLNPDRHTKHKFTRLSFQNKNNLLPSLTLGMSFNDLTMNKWKYNVQEGTKKAKIMPEDIELLAQNLENDKKLNYMKRNKQKLYESTYSRRTTFLDNNIAPPSIKQEQAVKKFHNRNKQNQKTKSFRIDIKHVQEKGQTRLRSQLDEEIEKTFVEAKKINMSIRHPTKNLKVKKVFQFQPDFPLLHMNLASIQPDQKYKKKDENNKCMITRHFGLGHMELLELYESCVKDDPQERLREEPSGMQDEDIMKSKIDFEKRYTANFENLQTYTEQKSTSMALLLLNFNEEKSIVKFSRIIESLVLRPRKDIMVQNQGSNKRQMVSNDIRCIEKKCIRLFPRNPTLQELQKKKQVLRSIDEKLKGRVQREIENIKKDNVDYNSYLPIGKTVFAKPKKEDISDSDNDSNNDDDDALDNLFDDTEPKKEEQEPLFKKNDEKDDLSSIDNGKLVKKEEDEINSQNPSDNQSQKSKNK